MFSLSHGPILDLSDHDLQIRIDINDSSRGSVDFGVLCGPRGTMVRHHWQAVESVRRLHRLL